CRNDSLCCLEVVQVRRHADCLKSRRGGEYSQRPSAQLIGRRGGEAMAKTCAWLETLPQSRCATRNHWTQALPHDPHGILETAMRAKRFVDEVGVEGVGENHSVLRIEFFACGHDRCSLGER